MPAEDVNDEKATIVKLYYVSGDKVKKGDLIFSFETTKAVIDVETEFDGFINYFLSEGDEASIGSLVCEISKEKTKTPGKQKNKIKKHKKNIKPTKKAISLAEKHGLVIENLGLKGIVKEKDLSPFLKNQNQTIQVERCLILDNKNCTIVLRNYKTSNIYGKKKYNIPKNKAKDMRKFVKIIDKNYLLINEKGEKMSSNNFSQFFSKNCLSSKVLDPPKVIGLL